MSARRVYETTCIVNAALEDPDVDAVIAKVTGYIENHGGEIQKVDKWGRKRLAYPINKKFNGFYIHIEYATMPDTIPILERFLVLEDTILRHLTLKLPDKLREFRAKRAMEAGKAEGDGSGDQDNNKADKNGSGKEEKKSEAKAEKESEAKAEKETEAAEETAEGSEEKPE